MTKEKYAFGALSISLGYLVEYTGPVKIAHKNAFSNFLPFLHFLSQLKI
jgi:hypothetical protein